MYNKPETFRTFVALTFLKNAKISFFSQNFNQCAQNTANNLFDTVLHPFSI